MEMTLREAAEYLRLGLAMRLIDSEAVVAWADQQIAALDQPPIEVIDVSLAGSRPDIEIIDLLGRVRGSADLTAAAHRALTLLLRELRAGGRTLERAVEGLWAYSSWATVTEDERLQAQNFSDALSCAQQGYYGTPQTVRAELETFLVHHAASAQAR